MKNLQIGRPQDSLSFAINDSRKSQAAIRWRITLQGISDVTVILWLL
jgi:hypothetical protein